jgi:hypothetical protein
VLFANVLFPIVIAFAVRPMFIAAADPVSMVTVFAPFDFNDTPAVFVGWIRIGSDPETVSPLYVLPVKSCVEVVSASVTVPDGSVTLVVPVVVSVSAFADVNVTTSPPARVIEFVPSVVLSETVNVLSV